MTFYTAAITLVLVMDPLGNIPVFLSVLKRFPPARQRFLILRETVIAFAILVAFALFGPYIMRGLHLTTPALSVAGGIILFIIAIRLIFPPREQEIVEIDEEPLVVPLAVPMTAGPSALATVMLMVGRAPHHVMAVLLAIALATLFYLVVVLSGSALMRLLGRRGLVAIERLMGMILTTVAVQMLLDGLLQFIQVCS